MAFLSPQHPFVAASSLSATKAGAVSSAAPAPLSEFDQPHTGESDAKSADDAAFENRHLIDGRRRAEIGAEHQPFPAIETNEAPDESVADEISSPIPQSASATDPARMIPDAAFRADENAAPIPGGRHAHRH